ncbi:LysR family transcriptional regulator [Castellaniella sp. GW247-6E4]|uniref:LysR family transcriptional regulator n=1 Tax=Castellaniella sp. GW247-6E4 TaxID=3140380 RepID=UPI00331536C0
MDFRQFRYFVTAAEELHFGRAAERLGITQPVLSQQIKTLETQLGGKLFNREKRRVDLTEMGTAFLAEAKVALAAADKAVSVAKNIARGVSGHIGIGIVGSVMYERDLARLFSDYCLAHPDITLSLNELQVVAQIEAVRSKELDLAIVREPIPAQLLEGLEHFTLSSQRLVAALPATHRLAKSGVVKLQDLAQEPFLGFSDPDDVGMHQAVLDLCRRAGFEPRFSQYTTNLTTLISFVGAGFGVGLVVDLVSHLQIPGVCYLPLVGLDTTSDLILVHRRFERSAAVGALLAEARGFARSRIQRGKRRTG